MHLVCVGECLFETDAAARSENRIRCDMFAGWLLILFFAKTLEHFLCLG